MAKNPYKASKAWHLGSELQRDVRRIIVDLHRLGEVELAAKVRISAWIIPEQLEKSHYATDKDEKHRCYAQARRSINDLQTTIGLVHDLKYINRQTFDSISERALTIHRLLSNLLST